MPPFSYELSGEGYPLVFIHGFCESSSYWEGVHDEYSDEFRVITLDLPGFGKSALPNQAFSLGEIGDSVADLLSSLSIDQCIIIGHSLGGYVALELLRNHRQLATAICLFNSSAFADPPDKKENRNKLIEFISKNGVQPFLSTFVPSLFYLETSEKHESVISRIRDEGMSIQPESVILYAAAMRDRVESIDLLTKYPDRVLLISGEYDQNVPLQKSREMAAYLKSSHFHIMPESAHMSWYEQRDLSSAAIRQFAREFS